MTTNAYGEMIPQIDKIKCTGCSQCERLCPQINTCNLQSIQSCYAAWVKNPVDGEGSSSGGIGHILASKEIDCGGVVCGCVMEKDATPRHVVIESKEDLRILRGSKYVQSDVSDAFLKVKKLLATGREVLFIGTPCQVAGLRKRVGKKDEGLYAVDLICHGTPAARYLREHLHAKTGATEFSAISFREKNTFALNATPVRGKHYEGKLGRDFYLSAFMCGDTYRESCYECQYARAERVGDLTIGDFWGLDRSSLRYDSPEAVSVILLNTEKGAQLLERISQVTVLEPRNPREAIAGNDQLRAPATGTMCRSAFRRAIVASEFDEAIRKSGLARYFFVRRVKASRVMAPFRAAKCATRRLK